MNQRSTSRTTSVLSTQSSELNQLPLSPQPSVLSTFVLVCISVAIIVFISSVAQAELIKLVATADIWLSDANKQERNSSSGKADRFKLKSIQEMAAIRFDATPIKGREIISAKLFLHPVQSENRLRYIRISTINQDWVEGNRRRPYSTGNGATYNFADHESQKLWAWQGSQFCDVTFSSGHSLSCWAEREKKEDGWISVKVEPEIITAMAVGDTDGIAVMDGGTIEPFNNFVHSHESDRYAPYLLVEVGPDIHIVPELPVVEISPDFNHATDQSGALCLRIKNAPEVFAWRIKSNDRELQRWQIPHPRQEEWSKVFVSDLPPEAPVDIEVTALSASGHSSKKVIAKGIASPSLQTEISLWRIQPPFIKGIELTTKNSVMQVWALPALVKISPLNSETLHPDIGWSEPIREANAVWDGSQVRLFGIRGEYVDFQICVEALKGEIENIQITPEPMQGPNNTILRTSEIEIFQNWYAKTEDGVWQPAYTIPISAESKFSIPDPKRGIPNQRNQTFSVDVYIPKDAPAGAYTGKITVANDGDNILIPIQLEVYDAEMPDELAFWPEMNAYHIPENYLDYYRLAHRHRCVANFWVFRPELVSHRPTQTKTDGKNSAEKPYKSIIHPSIIASQPSSVFSHRHTQTHTEGENSAEPWGLRTERFDFHASSHPSIIASQPPNDFSHGDITVDWNEYDKLVGPLLSGEAFEDDHRSGIPIECMYLPFIDSWPTPLSKETYAYNGYWPKKGESRQYLIDHYLGAPYIGDALSRRYKSNFLSVQKQFFEHFKEKGWDQTDFQFFFGGKKTHRTDYGSNIWWTTDEPYHWEDWTALRYFTNLWTEGRKKLNVSGAIWASRADISRPQWQGRVLQGSVDTVYYGGFDNKGAYQRCRILKEETGIDVRAYGSATPHDHSNLETVSLVFNTWLNGANGFLTWWSTGRAGSLDIQEGCPGNALLVPGGRFDLPVVADMRLKAFRKGEQLVEYFVMIENKFNLNRKQLKKIVYSTTIKLEESKSKPDVENVGIQLNLFKAWWIDCLRKNILEFLEKEQTSPHRGLS